jgi:hypothetical protein
LFGFDGFYLNDSGLKTEAYGGTPSNSGGGDTEVICDLIDAKEVVASGGNGVTCRIGKHCNPLAGGSEL